MNSYYKSVKSKRVN